MRNEKAPPVTPTSPEPTPTRRVSVQYNHDLLLWLRRRAFYGWDCAHGPGWWFVSFGFGNLTLTASHD